ncbi:Protein IMPAIRED IN BABA-INDUCED STERILITY 1 [Linum perenne]
MAGSGTEKDQNDTRKKSSRNSSIGGGELTESGRGSSNGDSLSFRLMNLHMFVEREQVSAGWPAWLSDVTGEAIQGWVPLKADSFQKLDKIHLSNFFLGFQID